MSWISTTERLPEYSDEYNVVWAFDKDEPVVTTMEFNAIEKKFFDTLGFTGSDCTSDITHWQPLPELP